MAWGTHRKTKFMQPQNFSFGSRLVTLHVSRLQRSPTVQTSGEQTVLAQSFTIKPEQGFQKLTTTGRQPLEAGAQGTPENPSFWAFGTFHLGASSWAFSILFWVVGEGHAGERLSKVDGEKEGGEQFLRTPAEVENGRQRVQEDRKGYFLGVGWGLLPFPPLSNYKRKLMMRKIVTRRTTKVASRVSSHWKSFLARFSCCLRRASRRALRRRSRSSCSP